MITAILAVLASIMLLLNVGIFQSYVEVRKELTKSRQDVFLFKNRNEQLEKQLADLSNKNLILNSLVNQRFAK